MHVESHITNKQLSEIVKRNKQAGTLVSLQEHTAKLRKAAAEGNMDAVGQMALGMIQMRSAYTGVARRVLVEDDLMPGEPRIYSIATQVVPALMVNPLTASAPIVRASTTRIVATPTRITSQFEIPAVDYLVNSQDPQDYYERNAIWGLAIEEDYALYTALESAIALSSSLVGADYGNIAVAGSTFTWESVTQAIGMMNQHRQMPWAIIVNPADAVDFYNWSIVTSGVNFKEQLLQNPDEIPVVGGLNVIQAFTVPQGTMYIITKPEQLGYMPQWGGMYIENNPSKTDQAVKAFTCNEYIAMYIMNCMAVIKLTKGTSNTNSQTDYIYPQANMIATPTAKTSKKDSDK